VADHPASIGASASSRCRSPAAGGETCLHRSEPPRQHQLRRWRAAHLSDPGQQGPRRYPDRVRRPVHIPGGPTHGLPRDCGRRRAAAHQRPRPSPRRDGLRVVAPTSSHRRIPPCIPRLARQRHHNRPRRRSTPRRQCRADRVGRVDRVVRRRDPHTWVALNRQLGRLRSAPNIDPRAGHARSTGRPALMSAASWCSVAAGMRTPREPSASRRTRWTWTVGCPCCVRASERRTARA
jgi:hypothetical protein